MTPGKDLVPRIDSIAAFLALQQSIMEDLLGTRYVVVSLVRLAKKNSLKWNNNNCKTPWSKRLPGRFAVTMDVAPFTHQSVLR